MTDAAVTEVYPYMLLTFTSVHAALIADGNLLIATTPLSVAYRNNPQYANSDAQRTKPETLGSAVWEAASSDIKFGYEIKQRVLGYTMNPVSHPAAGLLSKLRHLPPDFWNVMGQKFLLAPGIPSMHMSQESGYLLYYIYRLAWAK